MWGSIRGTWLRKVWFHEGFCRRKLKRARLTSGDRRAHTGAPPLGLLTYTARRRASCAPVAPRDSGGGRGAAGAGRAGCPGRARSSRSRRCPGGWGQGRGKVQPSCQGSGAAFSPASGSVRWQHSEDGVSFGRTPGPSSRRGRPSPHPVGRAPQVAAEGALGSRARPLRAAL